MTYVLRCLAAAVLYALADRVMPEPPKLSRRHPAIDAVFGREVRLRHLRIVDGMLGEMFGRRPPELRQ